MRIAPVFAGILTVAVILLPAVSCAVSTAHSADAHAPLDRLSPMAQKKILQATKPSDNEIVLKRTFAAPRTTVFAALTLPEHLLVWMQPREMPLIACEVDLRMGGTFRYVFQRPSGTRIEVQGGYESVDPPRGFSYRETYDFSPLILHVTTSLDAVGQETAFSQTLRYFSKRERDEDFEGVVTSSEEVYQRLDRYLAQVHR